jgi:hypothetical protein
MRLVLRPELVESGKRPHTHHRRIPHRSAFIAETQLHTRAFHQHRLISCAPGRILDTVLAYGMVVVTLLVDCVQGDQRIYASDQANISR